jgi:hypothetical protein
MNLSHHCIILVKIAKNPAITVFCGHFALFSVLLGAVDEFMAERGVPKMIL